MDDAPRLVLVEVSVAAVTHAIAALCFLIFAAFLGLGWRRRGAGLALIAAGAATALWAAVLALGATGMIPLPQAAYGIAEVVRGAAWLAFLLVLRVMLARGSIAHLARDPLAWAAGGLVAAGIAAAVTAAPIPLDSDRPLQFGHLVQLGLAVLGLLLVENVFNQTAERNRWAFKHLMIGLGSIFVFDLFLFSETVLFRRIDEVTVAARPLVNIAAIPFLIVAAGRIRTLSLDVQVSRSAVLQTTTLVASGVYLLLVAAIGYLIREAHLTWGPVLQLLFLAGAVMVLAVLVLSGQARARARWYIAQNFFTLSYDYRREWLRFISTMSAGQERGSLYERSVRAVADLFECSAGCLYLRRPDGSFALAGRWNWQGAAGAPLLPGELAERLAGQAESGPLSLGDAGPEAWQPRQNDGRAWLERLDEPWFVLPLRSQDSLLGAMVVGQPRARRALNWEDRELLRILSVQVGSYVAEERATRALMEAQRFERMSKRFAFIAHDLKNLVTQLNLVLHHAQRHGNNPEFLQDALGTVRSSVDKMQAMLGRLRDESAETQAAPGAVLDGLLEEVAAGLRPLGATIEVAPPPPGLAVRAERDRLGALLGNLVQNAIEASGAGARIRLGCTATARGAVIDLHDDGPGMSKEFIEERLFKPFGSGKQGGYGIGLYQARETLESWGGKLEIDSAIGAGTSVRLVLARPEAALPRGAEA